MRAYHLDEFGSLSGLAVRDQTEPTPKPHEIVVRVRARSLNYRDLLILHGRYPVPAREGIVPVSDGAGEVVAIGEDVRRFAVGDRVAATYFPRWTDGQFGLELAIEQFGCTLDGMLADLAVVDEQALVDIPSHLSFEEAATLPCAAVTAWSSLTGPRRVLAGESVLTIGTGGVALFALQFAKVLGACVVAVTSSPAKAELLARHGADSVVDSSENDDWEHVVHQLTDGRGVDHVVETGAIDTLPRSLASCADNGHVALVAVLGAGSLDSRALSAAVTLRRFFVGSRASFEAMNAFIAQHELRPVIDRVFGFEDAVDAYAHFAAKRHIGKVVIGA